MTLGHLVADAFERPEVRLDVYTLTSESLAAHIRFQVERGEAREIAPERIAVRLLLPHRTEQLAYPRTQDDPEDQRLGVVRRSPGVVTERQIELDSGEVVDALDVLGLGATLTRHLKDESNPNSPGSVFVESMSAWFESVWNHLAK